MYPEQERFGPIPEEEEEEEVEEEVKLNDDEQRAYDELEKLANQQSAKWELLQSINNFREPFELKGRQPSTKLGKIGLFVKSSNKSRKGKDLYVVNPAIVRSCELAINRFP